MFKKNSILKQKKQKVCLDERICIIFKNNVLLLFYKINL